mgnify:CR=1 FL=1
MKKDNIRDYAVDAFQYFATLKCAPTKEAVRFVLQKRHLEQCPNERDCRALEAEMQDMFAVVDTIRILSAMENGNEILQTLHNVYFANPGEKLKRGEVENRILYTTFKTHISTATAYRYLALCRRTFAEERGLRCAA